MSWKDQKSKKVTPYVANCFHCGDLCDSEIVEFDTKSFCCHGCKSVYELLKTCDLDSYYTYADNPGIKQLKAPVKDSFAYLDDADISDKILQFKGENLERVIFRLPAMHCASCIWLIENFRKLVPGISESRVNFIKREAHFTYNPNELSLRRLVEQLSAIGYEPELNLSQLNGKKEKKASGKLIYQIGLAGFCFGNIMLLSFPDYLAGENGVNEAYRSFFGYVNFGLALPVLFFSARDYLLSAYRSLKRKEINMDVPISMGMLALFLRSTYEIFALGGGGYMDSFAALIFFLLIGKWIQHKTYDNLTFERDFKSYFPIAVQKIENGIEKAIGINELSVSDIYKVRSGELIPTDSELIDGKAEIDYSFVTGEADPVEVDPGSRIYAGGRQIGASIRLKVLKKVDQSYLTSLWNSSDTSEEQHKLVAFADRVGKRFTVAVIFIALAAGIYWMIFDKSLVLNAVSAVLIVACPCALALSFPFAFGNAVRILGRHGLYLKNAEGIGKLAETTDIIFDKTGTLTRKGVTSIRFVGDHLSSENKNVISAMVGQSGHPLSRYISSYLGGATHELAFDEFKEVQGKGLKARFDGDDYLLGSAAHTKVEVPAKVNLKSAVYFSANKEVLGYFEIDKAYHSGLSETIAELKPEYQLHLLSGDGSSEKSRMEEIFSQTGNIHFNQSPHDKKAYVEHLNSLGKNTAMIGDGLNDAGALKASILGISVADDVFRFTPASHAILTSKSFDKVPAFFKFSKQTLNVVKWSFILSFLYNGLGVFFAVQGLLTPVIAAILMPLSSITVVSFVTLGVQICSKKYLKIQPNEKTDKSQFLI